MPTTIKFKVGADPEWCAVSGRESRTTKHFRNRFGSGQMIEASSYLHARKTAIDSLGSDRSETTVFESEKMGADGSGRPFELRPDPDEDPTQVVQNIANILKESADIDADLLDMDWFSGPYKNGWPMGGHIHFGLADHYYDKGLMVQKLDDYLGSIIAMVEGKGGPLRRNFYGRPGDCRDQQWGIEYRTPPSWLVSPYIASACLCLGKTIVHEFMNNKQFKWTRHSMAIDSDGMGERSIIMDPTPDRLLASLPKIWADIEKMELYKEYKEYIDIFHFLASHKLSWEPKCGMKAAWGIVPMTSAMPRSISLETIWNNQ